MTTVARLVTRVDVDDNGADARCMSVSACHEAVLVDGRRVVLLDDRGWTDSLHRVSVEEVAVRHSLREDIPDIWAVTSVEDIEETARCVVGPDEPFEGARKRTWRRTIGPSSLRSSGGRGSPWTLGS
jgi:hypothetical protein